MSQVTAPLATPTKQVRGPLFGASWRRNRLTVDERHARGKVARARSPRSRHGQWAAAEERPDPVALLMQQNESRVAELVPIRHGRMAASPLAFYRGAAAVMAADLAQTPTSGVTVQLCGDAHLSNFGVFGTPERRLLFDINDFDETLPGPWEWDVKRMAASFEVAGRDRGFSASERRDMVLAGVTEYRTRMRAAAGMSTLAAWYDRVESEDLMNLVWREQQRNRLQKKDVRTVEHRIREARSRDSTRVFAKRVREIDGELQIAPAPPVIQPLDRLATVGTAWADSDALIEKLLNSYRRTLGVDHHPLEEFQYIHAARKVVGVGSVGTRCYILLLVGRDSNDPLFLQVKEAQASVLEPYVGQSAFAHHGQRVVSGQRLMQAATDIFLGWQRITGIDGVTRDYYVRQFHDWKGGAEVENMRVAGGTTYARLCGATLARAHARWGDRIAVASYLGRGPVFDNAIADFCTRYADQNERDYAAFVAAIDEGRIKAQHDV